MATLKPLSDRIIVKAIVAEERTAGGIVLPDTAKEKPQEGEVLAVGPGKLLDNGKVAPMDVKVGDRVVYSKYGGTEIKLNGSEVVVLRQDDILGVVEGKAAPAAKSGGSASKAPAAKSAAAKPAASKTSAAKASASTGARRTAKK